MKQLQILLGISLGTKEVRIHSRHFLTMSEIYMVNSY